MKTDLRKLQIFLQVVEAGSFTKAATQLDLGRSMVSLAIKQLETQLRTTLLVRSTRRMALTEKGRQVYQDFKAIQHQIDQALERASPGPAALHGTLRIAATHDFGRLLLLPLLGRFCQQYPALNVDCQLDASPRNLISEHLDVAVRLGHLPDSGMKSRKIGEYDILMVATPDCVATHRLNKAGNLDQAPWIGHSNLRHQTTWTLHHKNGRRINITPGNIRHASNSASAIREMALMSLGIAICPQWLVKDDLVAGRLVTLLPSYRLPRQPIQLLFPNHAFMPEKTRAFIDFVSEHLKW
ncbi:LysR family transcriptional regulator [Alcanivorax sp. 24]|uniref:LysR family transcriptional regulator n=1 Tax=Alcanivorax sp. 24 TaxID=2545266 RepID=UPI00105E61D9|nr:LysR family transcriptional regulator [Alcanivorax sp. 24]